LWRPESFGGNADRPSANRSGKLGGGGVVSRGSPGGGRCGLERHAGDARPPQARALGPAAGPFAPIVPGTHSDPVDLVLSLTAPLDRSARPFQPRHDL